MQNLADLLAPVSVDDFFATYHGKRPLHIPATPDAPKASLLDWSQFNALLEQASLWNPQTLKLVQNTDPIPPADYCRLVRDQTGESLRPDPAKVSQHLARGASLVAGDVQQLTPDISRLTQVLGRAFSASTQANVYCSFKGVQAFGSHYDLTDVIAVQTEGQKLWRLYQGRADNPTAFPVEGPQVKTYFTQTRGPLLAEIMMKPGDVLYLPRGVYHDALAQEGASLHVTYALAPLHGGILFKLLEQAAMQHSDFRAYLPPADQDDGKALQTHLNRLSQYLTQLIASPQFRDEVAMAQEQIIPRHHTYNLPHHAPRTTYRRQPLMAPNYSGPVAHVMHHALSQSSFVLEDLIAQFTFVPEAQIRSAVDQAEQAKVIERVSS